ncbi:MAG TPA: YetF domain-containing protein [Burkholderiales bacterium]
MSPDWGQIFGLSVSPVELVIRGSAMYLFLFVLFRVVIRRRVGAVGMADILVLVIIADAAQNGMSGEYKSVTEGAILVATIVAWDYLIDWLNYHVPSLNSLLEAPPLLLIRDGQMLRRNMRHEFVTEEELKSKLREKGVANISEVKEARMESDGEVSVLKRNS